MIHVIAYFTAQIQSESACLRGKPAVVSGKSVVKDAWKVFGKNSDPGIFEADGISV